MEKIARGCAFFPSMEPFIFCRPLTNAVRLQRENPCTAIQGEKNVICYISLRRLKV